MAKERIPYFRFYPSDFMRGVRGMTPQEVGLYTMLICRMYEESGPIEDHALRLSTYCGMRQATFEKTLQKLVDLGKIEREGGMLFNDRARIEISDRSNDLKIAIRAGKASAKKRQQNQQNNSTPVQRPFNDTDTDTDTDTVKEEPKGSYKNQPDNLELFPEQKPPPKSRRRPELELPERWVPNDANIQHAQEKGFTMQEIDHEADSFRNHHHSKQNRFRDWDAAWRTWIANAIKFGRGRGMAGKANPGGYGQGGSIASIVARRRAEGKV